MPTRGPNATEVFKLCFAVMNSPSHSPTAGRPVHYSSYLLSNTTGNTTVSIMSTSSRPNQGQRTPAPSGVPDHPPKDMDGTLGLRLKRDEQELLSYKITGPDRNQYYHIGTDNSDVVSFNTTSPEFQFATLDLRASALAINSRENFTCFDKPLRDWIGIPSYKQGYVRAFPPRVSDSNL